MPHGLHESGDSGFGRRISDRLAIPIGRYQDAGATNVSNGSWAFHSPAAQNGPRRGVALPEKREHVEAVPLSAEQASLYQAYIARVEEALEQEPPAAVADLASW